MKTKQGLVGTKYSIGVYDRITSATWKYRNMVLPLLTLPERSVFVISTISSLGFGAYDRYRNKEHQANGDLNSFVEKSAHETAERQRDHYDYWYRILDEKGVKSFIEISCFMMPINLELIILKERLQK